MNRGKKMAIVRLLETVKDNLPGIEEKDPILEDFKKFWSEPLQNWIEHFLQYGDELSFFAIATRIKETSSESIKPFNQCIANLIEKEKTTPLTPNENILVGQVYYCGIGVPRSYQQAFAYFVKAYANPLAFFKIGLLHYYGHEEWPKDIKKALECFAAAKELKAVGASIWIAGIYFSGDGVEKNIHLALKEAQSAVCLTTSSVFETLSKIYKELNDKEKEVEFLEKAARFAGNPISLTTLIEKIKPHKNNKTILAYYQAGIDKFCFTTYYAAARHILNCENVFSDYLLIGTKIIREALETKHLPESSLTNIHNQFIYLLGIPLLRIDYRNPKWAELIYHVMVAIKDPKNNYSGITKAKLAQHKSDLIALVINFPREIAQWICEEREPLYVIEVLTRWVGDSIQHVLSDPFLQQTVTSLKSKDVLCEAKNAPLATIDWSSSISKLLQENLSDDELQARVKIKMDSGAFQYFLHRHFYKPLNDTLPAVIHFLKRSHLLDLEIPFKYTAEDGRSIIYETRSLLCVAASYGYIETVRALIHAGAKVDANGKNIVARSIHEVKIVHQEYCSVSQFPKLFLPSAPLSVAVVTLQLDVVMDLLKQKNANVTEGFCNLIFSYNNSVLKRFNPKLDPKQYNETRFTIAKMLIHHGADIHFIMPRISRKDTKEGNFDTIVSPSFHHILIDAITSADCNFVEFLLDRISDLRIIVMAIKTHYDDEYGASVIAKLVRTDKFYEIEKIIKMLIEKLKKLKHQEGKEAKHSLSEEMEYQELLNSLLYRVVDNTSDPRILPTVYYLLNIGADAKSGVSAALTNCNDSCFFTCLEVAQDYPNKFYELEKLEDEEGRCLLFMLKNKDDLNTVEDLEIRLNRIRRILFEVDAIWLKYIDALLEHVQNNYKLGWSASLLHFKSENLTTIFDPLRAELANLKVEILKKRTLAPATHFDLSDQMIVFRTQTLTKNISRKVDLLFYSIKNVYCKIQQPKYQDAFKMFNQFLGLSGKFPELPSDLADQLVVRFKDRNVSDSTKEFKKGC